MKDEPQGEDSSGDSAQFLMRKRLHFVVLVMEGSKACHVLVELKACYSFLG